MAGLDCVHVEGHDPRTAGWCVKCGRPAPKPPKRDVHFESRMLAAGIELAERVYGIPQGRFDRVALARLDAGASEYGDTGFLRSSRNLDEAEQEAPDAANWTVLELERLLPALSGDDAATLSQYAAGVVAAAVNLDSAVRRFRAQRDEILDG